MHVRCDHCGLDVTAQPGSEGRTLRCPRCGRTFTCHLPVAEIIDDGLPPGPIGELLLSEEVAEGEPETLELVEEEGPPEETETVEEVFARAARSGTRRVVEENPRQWYVMVSGVAAVALTFEELKQRADDGLIKPKTRIHYAREDLTLRARDIPGLFGEGSPAPAKPGRKSPVTRDGAESSADADEAAAALGGLGGGDDGEAEADEAADALRQLGDALEEE